MNIKGTFLGFVIGSFIVGLSLMIALEILVPVLYWGKTFDASLKGAFEPAVLLRYLVIAIIFGVCGAIIKALQTRAVI